MITPFKQRLSLLGLMMAIAWPSIPSVSAAELSDRTFRTVNRVQELIATERYDDAKSRLTSALGANNRDYDRAVLLQQMGFLYSLQDDYKNAARYFADSLAVNALPITVAQQVRYSLAQLYLAEAQYSDSVKTMQQWFAVAKANDEQPEAHAYIVLANAYVHMEDYRNAIGPATQAIKLSENPSESWYLLLMASHYELKQFKQVADVLQILTDKYPQNKRYWMQLSGTYMELNQERQALAALEMAYTMGLLDEEREYIRLVNFLAYLNVPYRAAQVLSQEMDNGNIKQDAENLERLANFWQQAKELDKSIQAYQQVYALEPKAETQVRIARLMLQNQSYPQVIQFVSTPAPEASRDQRAELAYLQGLAHFELQDFNQALSAMQNAAESQRVEAMVSPWLAYLQSQG